MPTSRRPLALIAGRVQQMPAGDFVAGEADLWSGATQYVTGIRHYAGKFSTGTDGRVTIYLTTTGLASGAALFSQIASVQATGFPSTAPTAVTAVPIFFVESLSTDLKTLVLRYISPMNLLALGATAAFGSVAMPGFVHVTGITA